MNRSLTSLFLGLLLVAAPAAQASAPTRLPTIARTLTAKAAAPGAALALAQFVGSQAAAQHWKTARMESAAK